MTVSEHARVRITTLHYRWLQAEADRWAAEGLIDARTRERILDRYDAEALQRQGMLAVVLLAVGMCAVGLLLLIGYNWALIPRALKVVLLTGALSAAYAGAAWAYATGRRVAGETLAFGGCLLFGCAFVLVAQVLQISGHVPDAILWFTIGVLACAWLVASKWIGIGAAVGLFAWIVAYGSETAGSMYPFLLLWPASVAVAYSLRSPGMLGLVALDAGLWAFMSGIDASRAPAWLASVVLTACAVYSAGRWHQRNAAMRWAWHGAGLVVLLLVLIPLMATPVQASMNATERAPAAVVLACVALLAAVSGFLRGARNATDRSILAVMAAVVAWTLAVWVGHAAMPAGIARLGVILFSGAALAVAVSLIRDALDSSDVRQLSLGVLFAAAFLLVRWTSLIENMFWSGLLLLAAGGGLLLVARLWRNRRRVEATS